MREAVAEPEAYEVADGVHAYVQPDGGWCLNNAGLVVGEAGALLVDTAATEARARRLRETVSRIGGGPPRVVVNTHHHSDHTFGNFVFAPDSPIVAHELCREEMVAAGYGLCGLFPDVEWGDLALAPPEATYRDGLTLHLGELRVELVHPPVPAHTTNDTVVWVPERKVVFTGDVVMSGVTPFCLMGSVEGSLRAVDWLRTLGATTVVAGHGRVAGPEVLDETEAYLRWIQDVAAEGVRAGVSPLEAARETDLGGFGELRDSERLLANLHRAYAELRGAAPGAPLDVLGVFQEMVSFHGGRLTCHA
ncbi:MBL fold metallo-hydrolase [Streptosporangium sp. NPDC051022]|uniref:MBL fold metallo-hydrolase n=1 Tax=Streptosporangium sp. NPDC051022 TaxID=3155752 RepID=UPI00341EC9C2